MVKGDICFLIEIARKYDIYKPIKTSTIKLKDLFGISQQSVSRILIEQEKKGLIKRTSSTKGLTLEVDENGLELLKDSFRCLSIS
jgi:CTP-dependent riboflavin kinase